MAAAIAVWIGALIGGLEIELAACQVRRMARLRLAEPRKDGIIARRRELLTLIVTSERKTPSKK
jgi:hypothetical protein